MCFYDWKKSLSSWYSSLVDIINRKEMHLSLPPKTPLDWLKLWLAILYYLWQWMFSLSYRFFPPKAKSVENEVELKPYVISASEPRVGIKWINSKRRKTFSSPSNPEAVRILVPLKIEGVQALALYDTGKTNL